MQPLQSPEERFTAFFLEQSRILASAVHQRADLLDPSKIESIPGRIHDIYINNIGILSTRTAAHQKIEQLKQDVHACHQAIILKLPSFRNKLHFSTKEGAFTSYQKAREQVRLLTKLITQISSTSDQQAKTALLKDLDGSYHTLQELGYQYLEDGFVLASIYREHSNLRFAEQKLSPKLITKQNKTLLAKLRQLAKHSDQHSLTITTEVIVIRNLRTYAKRMKTLIEQYQASPDC